MTRGCVYYIHICEQVCDYMWTCGNILCCIIPRYAHGSRITCFKRPISACCPHSKNELVYTVATKKKDEKSCSKMVQMIFLYTHIYIYMYPSSRPRFPFLKILGLLSYRASRKEVTNHLTYSIWWILVTHGLGIYKIWGWHMDKYWLSRWHRGWHGHMKNARSEECADNTLILGWHM
jgi:hypothetical protein